MHQARLVSTFLQNLFDALFLTEMFRPSNKLDFYTIFFGNGLRMRSNAFSQRLCKLGVIENPHVALVQIAGHCLSIAPLLHMPCDEHPVVAVQHAM